MRKFFRELLDPNGSISFMRFVAFPIIAVGLFVVVYGLFKSSDVAMYVGGGLVTLGVTGKAVQKGTETRAANRGWGRSGDRYEEGA